MSGSGALKVVDQLHIRDAAPFSFYLNANSGGDITFTDNELTGVGGEINVERAMPADGRFDGHIVQGHVDEVGRVVELAREGEDIRLSVACTQAFAELLVEKGSVAISGVSLPVAGLAAAEFSVALIPHTLQETTLGGLDTESPVNLEADVLGKYVQKYLYSIEAARKAAS